MTSILAILKSKIRKSQRKRHIAQMERELGITQDTPQYKKYPIIKCGKWTTQRIKSNGVLIEEYIRIRILSVWTPFCWKMAISHGRLVEI